MSFDKDELKRQYQILKTLFESDPKEAINQSQKIILQVSHFNTPKEFGDFYHEHGELYSCQEESTNYCLGISCEDCSLKSSIFLCLDCFFNGNHKGHKYVVFADLYGSCDCGNPSQMKPQGYCKCHKGIPNDGQIPNNLGDEMTELLTDVIFKAALSSLTKYTKSNSESIHTIFSFLASFIQFGDIFRRLLSISLTEKINFKELLDNILDYSSEFNSEFQTFCGKLVNDFVFSQNFSMIGIELFLNKILQKQILKTANPLLNRNIESWNYFWFQCFTEGSIKYNIFQKKWDWVTYIISFAQQLKKHFTLKIPEISDFFPLYRDVISCFPIASSLQPNEETQQLFDRFFNEVVNCDLKNITVVPVSYADEVNKYLNSIHLFNISLYDIFNCFKYNKKLKFDSLFDQLEKFIDISPIFNLDKDDKFALKFLSNDMLCEKYPSYYYNSFHNGASFFFANPIYDSLVHLFGLENICRMKIAEILSLDKHQSLRFKLIIITLKKLLSYVVYQGSIIPKSNYMLISVIEFVASSASRISEGFPLFLPLFQLLIGMKQMDNKTEFTLKEYVSFQTAKLLGIFDDFTCKQYKDENIDDKLNEMIFLFLYFTILIVVDRTLFNYDIFEFVQEQLVYAIKNDYDNLIKLQSFCDDKILDTTRHPLVFSEVLVKIATIQKGKTVRDNMLSKPLENLDIKLKEGVEWKPFNATVPFNFSKSLINKLISKNPGVLIESQEFEPEETYFFNTSLFSRFSISAFSLEYSCSEDETFEHKKVDIQLKELLFTPTVLAIVYHSLRKSENVALINDHLSMNVLILISKFLKQKDFQTQKKFDEKLIIHYSSIIDLITKIRTLLFNENSDEKTVENPINIENFKTLLKIKFVFNDQQPKSLLEILLEKGEVGKKVISILTDNVGLNVHDEMGTSKNAAQDGEEKKKTQKLKASQLKSNIMSSFNQMISKFSIDDDDEGDEDEEEEKEKEKKSTDRCSICGCDKDDEAVSYPIYIYPTKFPFIVDKPPEAREGENIGDSIEVACDDGFHDEFDEVDENGSNNNDSNGDNNGGNSIDRIVENNIEYHIGDQMQQYHYNGNNIRRLPENENRDTLGDVAFFMEEEEEEEEGENEEEEEEEYQGGGGEYMKKMIKRLRQRLLPEKVVNDDDNHVKRYTAGANYILQFRLCQHTLHPNCVTLQNYQCPIDRTTKNAYLPCLESFTTQSELAEKDIKSIDVFLNNFLSFIVKSSQQPFDVFVELIKSISGLVVTNEVRLRRFPGCLDSKRNKILARNLFLTAWHAYRIYEKPKMSNKRPYSKSAEANKGEADDDVELRLTEFQKFIKRLIECDDIEVNRSSFDRIVSSFINSSFAVKQEEKDVKRKEKELCLFLRRVCLADYFLLDSKSFLNSSNSNSQIVDWDEVFSVKNLTRIFNVSFKSLNESEEFEFKPFVFKPLPDEFLRLSQKPYKLPMNITNVHKTYDLFDFNDLINNYDDLSDSYSFDINEKQEQKAVTIYRGHDLFWPLIAKYGLRNYPTVLIQIGENASDIFVFCRDSISYMDPFYLDKNGFPDIGFFRYQPIYLNHEKYEKFTDAILSGEFTEYSHSILDLLV